MVHSLGLFFAIYTMCIMSLYDHVFNLLMYL